jgi:PmbA protein
MASRAFDFEGTPAQKTTIFENGVLKAFVHNTSTARMFDTQSTGSSTPVAMLRGIKLLLPSQSNIVFKNGDKTLAELLDNDKPTIYVTSNWYTRFQNALTGEFSTIPRDAMLLIENGETKPIKNLRISDNMLRMFANIDAMGNDRKQIFWWEVRTPTFIPSVRVSDCRMSAATL